MGDMRTKIDLYRRLARIVTEEELEDLRVELADRFGPIPAAVEQLMELARLRIWAHSWKIDSIHVEGQYVVLGYSDRQKLETLVGRDGGRLRVADDRSAYLPMGKGVRDIQVVLDELKSLLR
jgi:transcription-repair coupling factor (superfamily II helicase)